MDAYIIEPPKRQLLLLWRFFASNRCGSSTLRAESEGVAKGASFILASLISWPERRGSRKLITGYDC